MVVVVVGGRCLGMMGGVVGCGVGMPMLCVLNCVGMWWSLPRMTLTSNTTRGSPGGVPVL
eukprot:2920430-Alexandrium_andersonii.AAC.1